MQALPLDGSECFSLPALLPPASPTLNVIVIASRPPPGPDLGRQLLSELYAQPTSVLYAQPTSELYAQPTAELYVQPTSEPYAQPTS